MNNFEHRVFSIEPTVGSMLKTLCSKSVTAVHRCARKITEFASEIDVLSDCLERLGSQLAYASGVLSRLDIYS